jgi:hypothetical protein
MNIDDFLDSVQGDILIEDPNPNTPATAKYTASAAVSSTLEKQQPYGWDGAVDDLVLAISKSIAQGNYSDALDTYMQLKELPSVIIETDMKTQDRLKEEILKAHEKILAHMKEQEKKHSSASEKIKQLIVLALEELGEGRDEVASGLYVKACQFYSQLPSEFKERNVKLHYDLLKIYFKIKEYHDYKEHQMHQTFLQTFNEEYQSALSLLQSDIKQAKVLHDELHEKVLLLPNEEVQLKSKLLERLVQLRTQISYQEHKIGVVNSDVASGPSSPKSPALASSSSSSSSPAVTSTNPSSTSSTSLFKSKVSDASRSTQSVKPEYVQKSSATVQPSRVSISAAIGETRRPESLTSSKTGVTAASPQSQSIPRNHTNSESRTLKNSQITDVGLQKVPLQFAGNNSELSQAELLTDEEFEDEMQRRHYLSSPTISQSANMQNMRASQLQSRPLQSQVNDTSVDSSAYGDDVTGDDDTDASQIQRRIREVFSKSDFNKKMTPLPPSKIFAQTQNAVSMGAKPADIDILDDSELDSIMSRESSEIIQKLRSLNKHDTRATADDKLDDLHVRAETIKQKLRDLHGGL